MFRAMLGKRIWGFAVKVEKFGPWEARWSPGWMHSESLQTLLTTAAKFKGLRRGCTIKEVWRRIRTGILLNWLVLSEVQAPQFATLWFFFPYQFSELPQPYLQLKHSMFLSDKTCFWTLLLVCKQTTTTFTNPFPNICVAVLWVPLRLLWWITWQEQPKGGTVYLGLRFQSIEAGKTQKDSCSAVNIRVGLHTS